MNYAIEGIFQNGNIELVETPEYHNPVGVLVIFLEQKKQTGSQHALIVFDIIY